MSAVTIQAFLFWNCGARPRLISPHTIPIGQDVDVGGGIGVVDGMGVEGDAVAARLTEEGAGMGDRDGGGGAVIRETQCGNWHIGQIDAVGGEVGGADRDDAFLGDEELEGIGCQGDVSGMHGSRLYLDHERRGNECGQERTSNPMPAMRSTVSAADQLNASVP